MLKMAEVFETENLDEKIFYIAMFKHVDNSSWELYDVVVQDDLRQLEIELDDMFIGSGYSTTIFLTTKERLENIISRYCDPPKEEY